jgi:dihydroanticapsin dehydrogenase
MGRIEAKACIVTGAASGIGRATAERFAEEGGQVLCVDVDGDGARDAAERIRANGGTAEAEQADVAVRGQAEGFVARCVELWDGIEVLVNNAGVNLPGVFHEAPDETIERTLAVNVKGPIYACQAAIPHMLERGGGSIVNVSSVNGVVAEPYLTVYAAVDTPINYAHAEMLGGLEKVYESIDSFQPIGRPGEPREIANVALFLASDEASFLTGSVVLADGGMTAQ